VTLEQAVCSRKNYHASVPLRYGNEITIEAEQADASAAPRIIRARVVEVDNDASITMRNWR